MKVAIIGCGLIGKKRAMALGNHELVMTVDVTKERAIDVAKIKNCDRIETDYRKALEKDDIDIIIVSSSNDVLAQVALEAVKNKKHVIIEKPAGRNSKELEPIIKAAKENNVFVKVGFNHRYHQALQKAKKIVDSGEIGPLMFIRGRYGHGGRIGYEKEWRADPSKSGGGELIDQGVHLIDLSRWFLGDFKYVEGFANTYFWDMNVDDNGFMMLRTEKNQMAWLHASCTEWKNMFSFEIYGTVGKLIVDGLGGSYGIEKLFYYKMLPEMGPPETTIWEYPFGDNSWKLEFDEFVKNIEDNKEPDANIEDAYKALQIVEKIYQQSNYVNGEKK